MSRDLGGRLPIHYAAHANDTEAALGRIVAGDDPNAADAKGWTPLHFAAQGFALDVARVLIDRGAKIDATDQWGNTPLWVAVFNSSGNGEMIEFLLANGADPDHTNHAGRSPRTLADKIANYDVSRFFRPL